VGTSATSAAGEGVEDSRRRLKIAFAAVTNEWGGAEVHSVALASALRQRGHSVSIVQINNGEYEGNAPLAELGVAILRVDVSPDPQRAGLVSWVRVLGALRSDVVVLPKGSVSAGSIWLDLIARLAANHVVSIEHSAGPSPLPRERPVFPKPRYPFGKERYWLSRYYQYLRVYARSILPHRIVCVSDDGRVRRVRGYGFSAKKTCVIHNGTDTARYHPDSALRRAARQRWGIPEGAVVIGTIGRLSHVKGLDDLLDAFAMLRGSSRSTETRLVIVGSGPCEADLRADARKRGLENFVVFAGTSDRPWEVHCGFDIFALPSRSEGLPLALLEAIASGVVPVAFDVGGVREILSRPDLGWLVPPGDVGAFADALQAAVTLSRVERTAYGAAGRAHIRARFEIQSVMDALCDECELGAVRQLQRGGRPSWIHPGKSSATT
jgi:glycosyltransferase involved in cell wall biosynthesis